MTFVAIVPGTRPSTSCAADPADEPLARRPDDDRAADARRARRDAASSARLWSTVLPNPIPGSSQTSLLGDARGDGVLEALDEERLDVVDDVVVVRVVLHRARLAEHVHEADVHAPLGAQAGEIGVVAQRGDVVDDVGAGVDRRARRPTPSSCRSTAAPRRPAGPRTRARRGAAARRRGRGSRPGRVDSPPMSRMPAPSAHEPVRVRDRLRPGPATGRRRRTSPGVTLTTPMTTGSGTRSAGSPAAHPGLVLTAVDDELGAVDPARAGRQEERGGVGDLLDGAEALVGELGPGERGERVRIVDAAAVPEPPSKRIEPGLRALTRMRSGPSSRPSETARWISAAFAAAYCAFGCGPCSRRSRR